MVSPKTGSCPINNDHDWLVQGYHRLWTNLNDQDSTGSTNDTSRSIVLDLTLESGGLDLWTWPGLQTGRNLRAQHQTLETPEKNKETTRKLLETSVILSRFWRPHIGLRPASLWPQASTEVAVRVVLLFEAQPLRRVGALSAIRHRQVELGVTTSNWKSFSGGTLREIFTCYFVWLHITSIHSICLLHISSLNSLFLFNSLFVFVCFKLF